MDEEIMIEAQGLVFDGRAVFETGVVGFVPSRDMLVGVAAKVAGE